MRTLQIGVRMCSNCIHVETDCLAGLHLHFDKPLLFCTFAVLSAESQHSLDRILEGLHIDKYFLRVARLVISILVVLYGY